MWQLPSTKCGLVWRVVLIENTLKTHRDYFGTATLDVEMKDEQICRFCFSLCQLFS